MRSEHDILKDILEHINKYSMIDSPDSDNNKSVSFQFTDTPNGTDITNANPPSTPTLQVGFYSYQDINIESWSPTCILRWKLKNKDFDLINTDKVLQQMWQGSRGTQKWENIPVVE